MIKVNLENTTIANDVKAFSPEKIAAVHSMIEDKTGLGNDFLGWVDWANTFDKKRISENENRGR
jgi:glucose-6-phosphate isomerase